MAAQSDPGTTIEVVTQAAHLGRIPKGYPSIYMSVSTYLFPYLPPLHLLY